MAGRPAADSRRTLDDRPARDHKVEVACPLVILLEPPRDGCGLVDGWGLPLGETVNRVLLEPVRVRPLLPPGAGKPLKDLAADRGVTDPLEGPTGPEGAPRPAVSIEPPVIARGDRSPAGIGMQDGGQCRPPPAQ